MKVLEDNKGKTLEIIVTGKDFLAGFQVILQNYSNNNKKLSIEQKIPQSYSNNNNNKNSK